MRSSASTTRKSSAEFSPVRGAFLDGTTVVDGPFDIDAERSNPRVIAASTGDGRSLVLYQQNDEAMAYAARVRARLVSSGAPLSPLCASDAECSASAACTRGVCGTDGRCATEPIAGCCTIDGDCDDGDPCTTDRCNAGTCERSPACDAGVDGGMFDAAVLPDASSPDAGVDAASPDASIRRDAGGSTLDAGGSTLDAGVDRQDGGAAMVDGGCGCTVPGGRRSRSAWLLLAIAFALARARRRIAGRGKRPHLYTP